VRGSVGGMVGGACWLLDVVFIAVIVKEHHKKKGAQSAKWRVHRSRQKRGEPGMYSSAFS